MATYAVGQRLTAALIQELSDRSDIALNNTIYTYVKSAASTKNNNTLAADTELSGIALEAGTYWIKVNIFAHCTGSATPDIKTQWAFTGTWNNPNRQCVGPSSTNTGSVDAITPLRMGGTATSTNAVYGLAATSAFAVITEECFNVEVTVAGDFSLQWAQSTTDAANVTTVQLGSAVMLKKLT